MPARRGYGRASRARDVSLTATIAELGVTHASLVATQLLRLLRDGQPDALAGMKAILLGGSAAPPGLITEAHARGLSVHTSYGMTEMASTVTATPPDASLDALGTSGVVLPQREVRLAADGEVLVRGATLFAGYLAADATVQRPTDADGWFPTGDLGDWVEVGGERMLRIVGRRDHLFISGGENVQPEEVEAAARPARRRTSGRRRTGRRRRVRAPARGLRRGRSVDAGGVARRARPPRSRGFKVPIAFYPLPAEASAGMKVSRAALRERAADALTGPASRRRP